jgi:hypothetical protein
VFDCLHVLCAVTDLIGITIARAHSLQSFEGFGLELTFNDSKQRKMKKSDFLSQFDLFLHVYPSN